MLLKDKIAVVTGASNGIGKSIVDILLKMGQRLSAWILQRPNRGMAA